MQVTANGVRLEVEDHGPRSGEPLLLVMGLGMQLLGWPADFVALLVARGFRVIRFDNRDIGLSQSFDARGVPNLALDSLRFTFGLRVNSLTLMMTSSGARRLPGPSLKVRTAMISRPDDPGSVASIVEHYVRLYALIGSPAFPAQAEELRERFTASVQRSYRPAGTARQMVAIAADGDRSPLVARIRVPTQIIHGAADPLIPVAAGRDLHAKIEGAAIDVIEGMGHDLPAALWPRFVADIATVAARAATSSTDWKSPAAAPAA